MNVLHSTIVDDLRCLIVITELTEHWSNFKIYRYDDLKNGVPMFGRRYLPFKQALKSQDEELTPELEGSLKWDGCMNWSTRSDHTLHACDIEDLDWITPALIAARRWVSTHIKAWDKQVAE